MSASHNFTSIVAIHELNGNAKETWRDRASGKLWLEDFLSTAMPNARILKFGYDSSLVFSRSKSGIESFWRDLLNRLKV